MSATHPFQNVSQLVAVVGVMSIAGCGDDVTRHRSLELSECRLPRLAQAAQCGMLEVAENRAKPDGRKIKLFVGVLPANTLSPKPDPLFILAGGPGQAASQLAPFVAQLNAIRRERDIVLVDQRGTGRSAPLDCAAHKPDRHEAFETDPLPKAKACAAELAARGTDAAQYTTAAWVADLDAVRAALGYPRINLWGGSYGSRAALEYLRRHPDRVRSMILDGVAPPAMKISLDVWRTRDAAFDAIVAACKQSRSCLLSNPDPAATLAQIEKNLSPNGKITTVADPRTGEPVSVPVTYDLVVGALQPLTYAPELASLIPELLDRARDGDYAPLAAASLLVTGDLAEQMNVALHFSVTCAEDVARIDAAERAETLAHIRAKGLAAKVLAVCDVWPKGERPPDSATPVQSDRPVLLLSGALDPVTPPEYAVDVAKTLPNSKHIVAAGLGHIVSAHGCAPRLLAAFIDRAGFDTLPANCIERLAKTARPPFWPDRLAPQP
jgi:pimeloyl-ACP methyl ester carboxylesterase